MDLSLVAQTFETLRIPPPSRLVLLEARTLASAHVPPYPPDMPVLLTGVDSPELANIYEREFDEMWNGQFGPKSPSTLTEQSVVVDGSQVLVIFTPENSALENVIIPFVQGAESSVYFMAFSFTDYPLADAMIQPNEETD